MDQAILCPEIFHYLPFGPCENTEDFVECFYEPNIQKYSDRTLFAVFNKTKWHTDLNDDHPHKVPEKGSNEVLAGLIGLLNLSPTNLVTEIGCVVILPPFQCTHVASNATGLLLEYTLNLPSESPRTLTCRLAGECIKQCQCRPCKTHGIQIRGHFEVGKRVTPREGRNGPNIERRWSKAWLCWERLLRLQTIIR